MFKPAVGEKLCYTCKQPLRWVKEGVSKKTGRPYQGFWACTNDCEEKFAPRGVEAEQMRQALPKKPEQPNQVEKDIVDELKFINERLDRIEKFLMNNLGGGDEEAEMGQPPLG